MKRTSLDIQGIPSATFTIVSTDVAQSFSDAQRMSNGKSAIACNITTQSESIRYTFGGAVPVAGGLGHVLTVANGMIRLNSPSLVNSFAFLSAVAQTPGTLMVTMEFEPGTDLT